jgi:hypothetical protein
MPAFAAVTINDGQASPGAHTFNPVANDNGIYVWQDQTGGVSLGYLTLTYAKTMPAASVRAGQASDASRVWRHKISVAVPTMETLGTSDSGLTPAPTVACIHRANVEFIQPERGTTSVRKDVTAYVSNLLAHATFKSILNDQAGLTGA